MCTHMGGTSAMSAASNPTVTAQYTTADKTVEQVAPETIIRKSTYRTGVYAVTAADGAGITIKELRGSRTGSANDSNSAPEYAYQTTGAYIDAGEGGFSSQYRDNRDLTITKGVNWDNVQFVSGDTYKIRPELKALGFHWNGVTRRWEK